jgi:hypothetical protein
MKQIIESSAKQLAAKTGQTTCDNADQFPSRHCIVIRCTGLPQIQCSIFRIRVSCAARAGGIVRGSELLGEVQPLPQADRANDPERFVDSVVAAKFLSITAETAVATSTRG